MVLILLLSVLLWVFFQLFRRCSCAFRCVVFRFTVWSRKCPTTEGVQLLFSITVFSKPIMEWSATIPTLKRENGMDFHQRKFWRILWGLWGDSCPTATHGNTIPSSKCYAKLHEYLSAPWGEGTADVSHRWNFSEALSMSIDKADLVLTLQSNVPKCVLLKQASIQAFIP